MKKITALIPLFCLAGCIYAGDVNVLPARNKIFTVWQTEDIFYYDKDKGAEYLSESKTFTENNIEKNQIMVVQKGDVMASSQIYRTDFYTTETLRATKNATMSSSYSPLYISKDKALDGFGEVQFEGEKHMLVRQGKSGDILLVNGDGVINSRIGRIVDGRLAVLDILFFVEPEDVRIQPVITTRTETSDVLEGFELVYNGLSDGNISILYRTLGEDCIDEEILFPYNQESVEIQDLNITIIEADNNKIEYIIK